MSTANSLHDHDHVQHIQLYRRRSIAPKSGLHESWHGKFGHAKTRILSNNKYIMLEALTPTMEGHAVTVTDNHRHLGVVLSEDLKWSKHAQRILAAASKRAGLLRLMARDLPLPVASILYVYYVRPVLEYASPVWHGSLREGDAMSLERIQASVAWRSLLQADWFTPKEELFRQLGWPAHRWRREITSLTMFHKLLHSRPEPLGECLFQYASATSARSRRKPFQLLLPHTRTTRYRESFFYRSALLWNSLPHDIQSPKNSKSFRNALENHYQSYKFTTTQNFHIPLSSAFLSLQIVCTHIPDCVTSHATIFLQPLDGDPLDQGSSLLGNPY